MQAFDVLILGSGLAGLTTTLTLPSDYRIALVTKDCLHEGGSFYAQGGIAAVLDDADSIAAHVEDTLTAGAGLCRAHSVQYVVQNAKQAIDWLILQGVPFTPDVTHHTGFHLTREGGHRARRIIHAADATGRAVIETLVEKVRNQPNVTIFEYHQAFDLLMGQDKARCEGAAVLDIRTGAVQNLAARHTVLATGGVGQLFKSTTNPHTTTGDGIALAWQYGAPIINMEFIQFHPTSLYDPTAERAFLISESVRGEGGLLKRLDGSRFMPDYDPRAELAPRDIVARAIDAEIKQSSAPYVYLDISHRPAAFIREHFPNIHQHCLSLGIDMTIAPIPVRPAEHYLCGGIEAADHGKTTIPGLYAIGETAQTGLHGANRLASNSLLECLVFGHAVSQVIQTTAPHTLADHPLCSGIPADLPFDPKEKLAILRDTMTRYVGIIRNQADLLHADSVIRQLQADIQPYLPPRYLPQPALLDLKHSVITASLIVRAALSRHESRGLHSSTDYPDTADVVVESCQ